MHHVSGLDGGRPRAKPADLAYITALAEAGALKPVIDRRYTLDQAADAHRHVEAQHKKGNVILTI